jgi:uncharacterized membrane protein HdeD (DUF308 family)
VVSMIASSLVAGIVRVLSEIGVSQTAGSMVNSAYTWLVTLNPILLIILGVIVFIAGRLAKWIGIIMVIIGVILLALPFLMHLI